MKLTVSSFLLALLVAVPEAAVAENYAFLVGVQDYDTKHLKKLSYSRRDIVEFEKTLVESGYDRRRIVLMHDELATISDRSLIAEASKIRSKFTAFLSLLEADDTLVVGMAGHGIQFVGEQDHYFCPADANLTARDRASLISLKSVVTQMEGCKARRKLLLIDACRNDPLSTLGRTAGDKVQTRFRFQLTPPAQGLVALFSCAEGQVAFEHPELKHGIFFHTIINSWRDKTDKELTVDELIAKAKDQTKLFAFNRLDAIQTPRQQGFIDGAWVLRKVSRDFVNSIGMKLVQIQPGEFLMGSPESEKDRDDSEHQHRVRITQPYFLASTEVTQKQWEDVMRTTPWKGKLSVKEGPNYAATYVSWEDAQEFCRKLSAKEGVTYRLPTEAQWEYACRAGAKTQYGFGDDDARLSVHAWWGGFFNGNAKDEQYAHEVGRKRPNAWGLHDMHGNVWEWCLDWYESDYYKNSPVSDPTGPRSGQVRVYRGGGWHDYASSCRSANRFRNSPADRYGSLGFRVAAVRVE